MGLHVSQRDLEGVLEDLDPVYRRIEDCEDTETLRAYAQTLRTAARRLTDLAFDYDQEAQRADETYCPECGTELCATCGECPACGDCCAFDLDDDDFPMYLEYDDQDSHDTDVYGCEYDR